MGYFYIAGTILFTVYGQLILKWRIAQYGVLPELIGDKIVFLFKLLFDPYILSGFVSAFIASFFWMAAMTKFDLSVAYPIIIAGLVIITTMFAIVFLNEVASIYKILGIVLIICGVYFLTKVSS